MAVWWLTEALPIYATALLPLVTFPLLGARSMREAAAPYAHELIFLFLGGFLIALAMQRSGLHRRIALLTIRVVGERPSHILAGFMGVTALLSMWVSNTATAIMMLPVATSVIGLVSGRCSQDAGSRAALAHFSTGLLLSIAYAASIGGLATPIGTPPNLFVLSFVRESLGVEVSFVRWMAFALPLVAVFLPIAWFLLARVLHPADELRVAGGARLADDALAEMGRLSRGEWASLVVFGAAAALWMTRPWLVTLEVAGAQPFAGLTDPGIAIACALVLFATPTDWSRGEFALDWETARGVPWGVLLLFGGGLSLAAAMRGSGVSELLGGVATNLEGLPPLLIIAAVVAAIIFLTELTSNTATAAALIPILAAIAPGIGIPPLTLAASAALAASCAFMLPVATPPNAVVFGSGLVGMAEMSRAGLWLNWTGIVLITGLAYWLAGPVLAGG